MGALDGKVAIVTGAGRLRGIGRAAAASCGDGFLDHVGGGAADNPHPYSS